MCGIAGYVGHKDAVDIVLAGLRRLEYRGYDSAGLAVLGQDGLAVHKVQGRIADLVETMPDLGEPWLAIGHTRWATHGVPSVANAHPHVDRDRRFAIVHNGIIENAASVRAQLEAEGIEFASSTDTEVIVHLMATADTSDLEAALQYALTNLEGTYGIAAISIECPDQIAVARNGSPVVIGVGDEEYFVGSDVAAFGQYTQRAVYLEDRELAIINREGFFTRGLNYARRNGAVTTFSFEESNYDAGSHPHFMHKEIHEQPISIPRLTDDRLNARLGSVDVPEFQITESEARSIRRVKFVGCGSAYYAGVAGIRVIENLAGVPAEAEPASEFRYREAIIDPDTLYVALSQSGETLDTLQAIWEIRRQGGRVVGIVNVPGSSIARACDQCLYLNAGPEVSVTSTKSFSSTYVAISLLALDIGRKRSLSAEAAREAIRSIEQLPEDIHTLLDLEDVVFQVATRYAHTKSAMFIGRLSSYSVALEASLKLKEVSYIHAEAYPCGELKHGPLALVCPELPTVAVVPNDALFSKNLGTLEEIRARRGPIIAVGQSRDLKAVVDDVFLVPQAGRLTDPLLHLIPLQLFAYHTAVVLGLDVDKPRNLAKSVTVE